jgi:hypothetical protein
MPYMHGDFCFNVPFKVGGVQLFLKLLPAVKVTPCYKRWGKYGSDSPY